MSLSIGGELLYVAWKAVVNGVVSPDRHERIKHPCAQALCREINHVPNPVQHLPSPYARPEFLGYQTRSVGAADNAKPATCSRVRRKFNTKNSEVSISL